MRGLNSEVKHKKYWVVGSGQFAVKTSIKQRR
jgi:hypothetical protein